MGLRLLTPFECAYNGLLGVILLAVRQEHLPWLRNESSILISPRVYVCLWLMSPGLLHVFSST